MQDMTRFSRKELAELLSVAPSTISRHKSAGMPINQDNKTFNAPECIQWLLARVEQSASNDSGETDESRKWLTAFRRERAKTAKIERLEKEKTLIPEADIVSEWCRRASIYRKGLLAFTSRTPGLLVGKNQAAMTSVLHDEACLLLASLSQDHRYCPAASLPKEYVRLDKLKICNCKKKPKKTRTKRS